MKKTDGFVLTWFCVSKSLQQILKDHSGLMDFYDVDMFQVDVKALDWYNYLELDDNYSEFMEGLMDFCRSDIAFEWFGNTGLSIIFIDLEGWAREFFKVQEA